MSVLIRGMEMPTSCIKCKLCVSYKCVLTGEIRWSDEFDYDSKRFEDCPLVPVPPHGRLLNVLKTERECVSRDCDRNCGKCELSLEQSEILSAYDTLISMLSDPAEEGET